MKSHLRLALILFLVSSTRVLPQAPTTITPLRAIELKFDTVSGTKYQPERIAGDGTVSLVPMTIEGNNRVQSIFLSAEHPAGIFRIVASSDNLNTILPRLRSIVEI